MEDAETKRCSRCGLDKPVGEFAYKCKRNGQRQPYCRVCQAVYHREHYLRNKAKYMAAAARSRRALREKIRRLKEQPCSDCGVRYPYYVMDFDHREGQGKLDCVNRLLFALGAGRKDILAEIAKCDVVCANCHRERTYQRRQWTRRRSKENTLL